MSHTPPLAHSQRRRPRRKALTTVVATGLIAALIPSVAATSASALTSLTSDDGTTWNINDSRRPGLDTGSIRNISNSRVEGFGNIFVHVEGSTTPRMNDQMLRGFGLNQTGDGEYASTASVRLGDLLVTRKLRIDPTTNIATFFDTFTNSATTDLTVDVSFGGSLGYGVGATAGVVNNSSDGDALIEAGESWATATSSGAYRPTGIVLGSAAPFAGATTRIGDQEQNPFEVDYSTTGSSANDPGFINELTIAPGTTKSLARYVVVGAQSDTTNIVTATQTLAAAPDFSGLTPDEVCTIANWDLTTVAAFDPAVCSGAEPLKLPAAPVEAPATTDVEYDVNGKTIEQLQTDMRAGTVTSVDITQAYLDRISAYNDTQLGFKAFISVADNALDQAADADAARKEGKDTDLLGIPIALKDLYDTKDQVTTGGTLALKDWQPATDAWQVAKLREAGAVLIGKTNLSEFANSGSWSESGFKQTWNALYPSKSSFGSSGGSAVATATSMSAAAMGTQTGVSLYAPSTGAGVSAFRGTDGLTSAEGVMPLTWGQDYAGPIAKTVTDLAYMLDATATQTTGNNPDDILTSRVDNSKRPTEWKTALTTTALQGKKIGYVPSSFVSTSVTDDTAGQVAFEQAKAALEAAGATLVPMTGSPSTSTGISVSGSAGAEGWERYIASHDGEGFPFSSPKALLESKANLPYNVSSNYTSVGMDDANTENYMLRRDKYKENAATWMDTNGAEPVDAVIYPGFISSMGNNDANSAIQSSDRASGVLTSNLGLPTAILPIGTNAEGQSNNIQIVGRAWDDAKILGMGYALEQQVQAHVQTEYAPSLTSSGPAASTTSVTLAATAVPYGTSTTAAITVASKHKVAGSVSVSVDGKTVLGALADGAATVTLPATVGVGTHLVTVTYAGTATVEASAATATLKVTQGVPAVTATLSKKSAGYASPVALTVKVTGSGGVAPASSTVLVYDGTKVVRTATIGATGSGVITLPTLAVGKHKISAYVVGSGSQQAVTSAVSTLSVVKASSTVKVKAKKKGRQAVVTITTPGSKAAIKGTVKVTVNGKTVKKATITAAKKGKITIKLPGYAKAGKVTIKATYSGSSTVKKSVSKAVKAKVSKK